MHLLKWLYPGMKFKRWLLLFAAGVMIVSLGIAVVFNYKYIDHIEEAIFRAVYLWSGGYDYKYTAIALSQKRSALFLNRVYLIPVSIYFIYVK